MQKAYHKAVFQCRCGEEFVKALTIDERRLLDKKRSRAYLKIKRKCPKCRTFAMVFQWHESEVERLSEKIKNGEMGPDLTIPF